MIRREERDRSVYTRTKEAKKKYRILKRIHHSVIKFDNNSEFIAGRDEKTEY
jgi:hypothetical protein